MRKIYLLLMIMFTLVGCMPQKETAYHAGTYEAVVQGHNTKIKLSVTVDDENILSVDVLEQKETSGIADPALKEIPKRIVEGQTLNVDTISSCTITSLAILEGASEALKQAGADVEWLKNKPQEEKEYTQKSLEADVVVIGCGMAGLSASTTVAEAGGSVIVLEKMENCGGNTMRSGGTVNAIDPIRQSRQGIVDSVELYIKNTYENGGMKGNLDLIRVMCENSQSARYWIEEHGGKWNELIYLTIGGLWPRSMDAKNNATETLIDPLLQATENNGGEILLNCKAEELLQDEDGTIIGVKAYGTKENTEYTILAHHGVIMATGGFAANAEMVNKYSSTIPENNPTSNAPCATGDGILMAEAVNANLVDMEYIIMHPNPGTNVYFTGMIDNSIYVNQNGERFVNEQSDRDEVCYAILDQPGQVAYVLFDSNTINEDFWSTQDGGYQDFVKLAEEGKCGYGETVEELAESIEVDKEALQKTIDEFNEMVEGKLSDPFGRELFYKKIEDGPYYASIRTARTHNTLGGIEINTHAEVLDIEGNVIPHFYAAGEVTGGIHGSNRIGGNSLTDCIVFGRIAGVSALEAKE